MPNTVSKAKALGLVGYAALGIYAHRGSAVSPEANATKKAASGIVEAAERSVVLFGAKAAALSILRNLADECSEDNWDAAGGQAIDLAALARTEGFLRALPNGIRMPECSPEPDGSISLDWSASRRQLFSVSVGTSDRLAFAWLDGSDRGRGVARFDGRVVPEHILSALRSIVGPSDVAIWAA